MTLTSGRVKNKAQNQNRNIEDGEGAVDNALLGDVSQKNGVGDGLSDQERVRRGLALRLEAEAAAEAEEEAEEEKPKRKSRAKKK